MSQAAILPIFAARTPFATVAGNLAPQAVFFGKGSLIRAALRLSVAPAQRQPARSRFLILPIRLGLTLLP